ncbi:MAG TPA: helix-turn-helix transcriptional regulator [Pseudolabrys sp.]|jgi:AraC-like DNA-binding protein|nr:helix-turn-helix transcriptional regulator [Pseudolabrys sp.]
MAQPAPIYRRNMDDAPRQVAVMARGYEASLHIPLHTHRRGQLLHAVSGIMRVETTEAAWIVPPARALWLPPQWPHSVTMRSHLEMRTVYIAPGSCEALPQQPVLVEISGLLRELILALLKEPADYDEGGRGGSVAQLILAELARLRERKLEVPMPRDARALRVARALLSDSSIDYDLDRWAEQAGASRRTLARLFRSQTGLGFAEWRARLRAVDGLARLSAGASVAETAASVGYASPSAFSAMIRRTLGGPPRRLAKQAA